MSERLVLLNINYSNHDPENGEVPAREESIREFIGEQKAGNKSGETTVVLIDTVWNDRFGEDEPGTGANKPLAAHLGMRAAFHTRIDDEELNQNEWKQGVGITVATDHDVSKSEIARLGTGEKARNALFVDLELPLRKLGTRTLTLAALYFPETDSHTQMEQASATNTKLNGDQIIPKPSGYQIVAGDFNALDQHYNYEGLLPRMGSMIVHQLAKRAESSEDRTYRQKTLLALDRRLVVPRMRQWGYSDAKAGPTYPSRFPMLDPDHVFSYGTRQVGVKTAGQGLSDHLAIVYDFELR